MKTPAPRPRSLRVSWDQDPGEADGAPPVLQEFELEFGFLAGYGTMRDDPTGPEPAIFTRNHTFNETEYITVLSAIVMNGVQSGADPTRMAQAVILAIQAAEAQADGRDPDVPAGLGAPKLEHQA